jgi:hypothetical protein
MPRHGVYANRNAGHKARQAGLFAEAKDDAERLAAAFAWFRSSAALLARRRPPKGSDGEAHARTAARLMREMTVYLKRAAEAIDRGDYDTERVTRSDSNPR